MNTAALPDIKSSVLVVDDDEFSRDVLQEMLQAQGVTQISMASNGRIALHTLSDMSSPPDLIVCDVFMPDMDGIEFMSALARQQYKGSVVLVTGVDIETLSLARDIAAAEGIKLLGSLTKPLRHQELTQILHQALASD
jgi:CheY-like chemotaxis protein